MLTTQGALYRKWEGPGNSGKVRVGRDASNSERKRSTSLECGIKRPACAAVPSG